jgi:hypothetical protein
MRQPETLEIAARRGRYDARRGKPPTPSIRFWDSDARDAYMDQYSAHLKQETKKQPPVREQNAPNGILSFFR